MTFVPDLIQSNKVKNELAVSNNIKSMMIYVTCYRKLDFGIERVINQNYYTVRGKKILRAVSAYHDEKKVLLY